MARGITIDHRTGGVKADPVDRLGTGVVSTLLQRAKVSARAGERETPALGRGGR
jgi:hypothetical protein